MSIRSRDWRGSWISRCSPGPRRRSDATRSSRRSGTVEIRCLAVSKVGSLAIDLPDANVAIQISGTFGSRQEEAQRLGRILRPKSDGTQAHFYSLVSTATVEQEFAMNRQRFLCEQGYEYAIVDAPDAERVTTTSVAEAIVEAGGTVREPIS